ncbi:hypothetical protein CCR75_002774 [Bremia lactucae]|uniref:Uncharacterized protein n=1 Tax=Bremia lactucae TaxID=4779 RepID=A0A976FRC8_BRELC|nr:hypothetical protein CCR75_002774 [Bremia lactucae]
MQLTRELHVMRATRLETLVMQIHRDDIYRWEFLTQRPPKRPDRSLQKTSYARRKIGMLPARYWQIVVLAETLESGVTE